jgi:hypothetical protein
MNFIRLSSIGVVGLLVLLSLAAMGRRTQRPLTRTQMQ